MASQSESMEQLNAYKVELIRANLETALSFARLALQSEDQDEMNRHRQNACDSYEEALHSLRTTTLTHIEFESIRTKMAHLESVFMELGEFS